MELWIRSQDRENTVKIINQYGLKRNDKKTIIANYQPDFTDKYDGYYEILGTYKTEERALEVLDEIQNLLMPIVESTPIIEEDIKPEYTYRHYVSKGSDIEVIQLNTYVYEMPEE